MANAFLIFRILKSKNAFYTFIIAFPFQQSKMVCLHLIYEINSFYICKTLYVPRAILSHIL